MFEYVYLVREREFIRMNEHTYKIGKTKQENMKRINGYPKGTDVINYIKVDNCNNAEKELIQQFKINFKHMKEYGNEYFNGDIIKIKQLFKNIVEKYDIDIINKNIIMNDINNKNIIIKSVEDLYKNTDIEKIIIINLKYKTIISNLNMISGIILFKKTVLWKNINSYLTIEKYLDKYTNISYDNNFINEIYTKCYNNTQEKYIFKYYEFLIIHGINTIPCILDLKNKNIIKIEKNMNVIYNNTNNIIYYTLNDYNNTNLLKIKKILNSYVNSLHLNKFKELCKSIFIKNNNIIFEDEIMYNTNKQINILEYFDTYNLTMFLIYMSSLFLNVDNIDIYYPNDIKKMYNYDKYLTGKIRLIILFPFDDNEKKQMIENLKEITINIIIVNNKTKYDNYNKENLQKTLIDTFPYNKFRELDTLNNKSIKNIFENNLLSDMIWWCFE